MNILIADDHNLMREGICVLLEKASHTVVSQAADGIEAVKGAEQTRPDIVLMDVCMPKLNGIEATKRIKNNDESVKIIGLSEYLEKIPVIRMLKAGALGYLLKSCVFENLLTAIEKVSQGKYFLSPEISNFVVDDYLMESEQTDPDKKKTLTERDCRIIQMLSEGKTNKQIALELGLNPKTTDACKRNIMNKLEIYSIAELTKFAVQQGLTPLAV